LIDERDLADALEAHRMNVSGRVAAFVLFGVDLLNADWLQRVVSLCHGKLACCRCKSAAAGSALLGLQYN